MPLRFVVVLVVFALCSPAEAQQQGKIFRIGYLDKDSEWDAKFPVNWVIRFGHWQPDSNLWRDFF